jgi:hypothetical protein
VHDSPDYHRLKVSVFNDDKKTELIGETWANLEAVITPGGGQSDDWHPLTCKGKYAGEIRIEITYYDTRPKAEKPVVEKRRESMRADGQSPALGGPRESKPIKRRPLPSDPTGASPSPVSTPEQRGLRGIRAGPRELGSPRHQQPQERTPVQQRDTPSRRPLPDASPMNGTPVSNHNTLQRQSMAQDPYTPPNTRPSLTNITQKNGESFDMSYAAPKLYEVQPINAVPQHMRDPGHRSMAQEEFHSRRQSQSQSQSQPPEPVHSHSAPLVPTQHSYDDARLDQHGQYFDDQNYRSYSQDPYQDPSYQVAPLRPTRSHDRSPGQISPSEGYHSDTYGTSPSQYDEGLSYRRRSAMQPMVEDEDDLPPPPPMHKRNASTLPHPLHQSQQSYQEEGPPPLDMTRYQEEPPLPPQASFDPPKAYGTDYGRQQPTERRYTHPRGPTHPSSRPESRDTMAPSPLRQETIALPSSLIPGLDPSREMVAYQTPPPSYDTPPRLRQYSEPADYRAVTQYNNPSHSQQLVPHGSLPPYDPPYYEHDPPEQPRRTSPVHKPAPLVRPRATSPGLPQYSRSPNPNDFSVSQRYSRSPVPEDSTMSRRYSRSPVPDDNTASRRYSRSPVPDDDGMSRRYSRSPVPNGASMSRRYSRSPVPNDDRMSRGPARIMPPRKSVSPRPPMEDQGERRLSGIAFSPDSFDVYNPGVSKSPVPGTSDDERPGSRMEYNDKGQIVTFSGRVVDASDHLPIDNWAPEPTPKGTVKEKPIRARVHLNGSRDLQAAQEREERYQRDREARNRLRNSASQVFTESETPSNALVTTRHDFNNSGALVLADRRSPRPSFDGAQSYDQRDQHILRERQNTNGYAQRYGNAPPIPAKVPLETGRPVQREDVALSLELQSIDIGPGCGGRRPRAQAQGRRGYGY